MMRNRRQEERAILETAGLPLLIFNLLGERLPGRASLMHVLFTS